MHFFIIAGNYHQANDYARKENFRINDFHIINDEYQLRGYRAKDLIFLLVGNYWDNPAYESQFFNMLINEGATAIRAMF